MSPAPFAVPASFTQAARYLRSRRGWVCDNVALAWRLEGRLDSGRFGGALEGIVRRHESLRTALRSIDGRVTQVVHPDGVSPPVFYDLSGSSRTHRVNRLERIAAEEATRPFDLAEPTPLRVRLIRMDSTEHVMLLVATHAFWDGWSTGVFLAELRHCYEAACEGREPRLPAHAIELGDFVSWQRSTPRPRAEAYWRSRPLDGWPVRNLPEALGDPSAPALLRQHRVTLADRSACERLRAVARASGTTFSTALLASYAFGVAAVVGADENTVAVLEANREHPASRGLIGCLADYIWVGTSVPRRATFRELLERTHARTVTARTHMLPLDRLFASVEALLGPGPDENACPFDVVFNDLTIAGASRMTMGAVVVDPMQWPAAVRTPSDAYWHRAKLVLNVEPGRDGALDGILIYRAECLRRNAVSRLSTALLTALEHGATRPDQPLRSTSSRGRPT